MDQRDDLTWIAIELTKFGESKVEDGSLAQSLRRDLGVDQDHEVFIPAVSYHKRAQLITIHLVEGYAFVASGLPEVRYFALERRPYVSQVMSTQGGPHRLRVLSTIRNIQIDEMKTRLRTLVASDIEVEAKVRVTEGTYRNLDGVVLDLDGDHAAVSIALRSLNAIARIPRVFLETVPG